MKVYTVIIIFLSIMFSCLGDSPKQGIVQPGKNFISPDKMYSFKVEYYDREYHFEIKDLNSGKITSLDFEQGPVLAVKWTSDSKSIFIAAHYARGKLLEVTHFDGQKWSLNEIVPPENNIGEYEVLNWLFHKGSVKLFFKFSVLDANDHPTNAYRCSLDYDPSSGTISNYRKEQISFAAYGDTKSVLAPD